MGSIRRDIYTKDAICSRCGKDLHHRVPIDATNILCFKCSETLNRRKDKS